MSDFKVDIKTAKELYSRQYALRRQLLKTQKDLLSVQNQIRLGTNTTAMKKVISGLRNETNAEWSDLGNLAKGLEGAVAQYENTERILLGEEESSSNSKWKNVWKIVGKAGSIGSLIGGIGKFCVSDKAGSDWASLGSDLWSSGWKIGKSIAKVKKNGIKAEWSNLIGLGSGAVGKIAKSNLGRVAKAKHGAASQWKNTFREFKTTGGKIKQIGGIAFSAAVNGFLNYDEFKEKYDKGEVTLGYAVGRGTAEVVTETAVEWGKSLAIGTAVAAGFAAAGVAAPAVVVGAATVAVSIGADWACKKITGALTGEEKGVTEAVSDFVLDTAENVGKAVSQGVNAAWSGLKKGFNNLNPKNFKLSLSW